MNASEFREYGKATIDLIADYIENIRNRDPVPSVEPGWLVNTLPETAPEQPGDWKDLLNEFDQLVLPGITHWASPRFHGYYPTGNSFPSILGAMLSEAVGVIGFNWVASPACTELEVVTLNWLGKLLGLPEDLLSCSDGPGGGVIQGSASEATLVCLLASADKKIRELKESYPVLSYAEIRAKLVAYTSDQSNSSVEKAGILASIPMRLLKSDVNCVLRGETLKQAIEEDKAKGLIPFYVVANMGTTGTCAFDPLYELGPVCKENNLWLHVDAAYAGSALICPEFRYIMKGIEYVESFNLNPHKWLLVSFDLSALWVKNANYLINAFDIQRVYLSDIDESHKIPDYRHWQLPLGRRFRALKLWAVMKTYGAEGLRKHIRHHVAMAKHFAKLVRTDSRFIIEPEPALGLVCIRLNADDSFTKKLFENIMNKKKLYLVAATYHDRYIIRVVICSREITKEDVDYSWNIIKTEADRVLPAPDAKKLNYQVINHIENSLTLSEKGSSRS